MAAGGDDGGGSMKYVEELTADTVSERIDTSDLLLLLFYEHTAAPIGGELEKAAQELLSDDIGSPLSMGRINLGRYPEVKRQYGILEPPKLKLFRNGKERSFRLTQPTADAIAAQLRFLSSPPTTELSSAAALERVLSEAQEAVVVGVFGDRSRPSHNLWMKGAEKLRDAFYKCVEVTPAVANGVGSLTVGGEFSSEANRFAVVKPSLWVGRGDVPVVVSSEFANMSKVVAANARTLVGPTNSRTRANMLTRKQKLALLVYDFKLYPKRRKYAINRIHHMLEAAPSLGDGFAFSVSDLAAFGGKRQFDLDWGTHTHPHAPFAIVVYDEITNKKWARALGGGSGGGGGGDGDGGGDGGGGGVGGGGGDGSGGGGGGGDGSGDDSSGSGEGGDGRGVHDGSGGDGGSGGGGGGGDSIDVAAAVAWLLRVADGSEPPHIRSEPPPETETEPEAEAGKGGRGGKGGPVAVVTAMTHDGFAREEATDALLCLYQHEVPPALTLVGLLFADVPSIRVGAMNLSRNDADADVYPADALRRPESFFFFPAGPKARQHPLRYVLPKERGRYELAGGAGGAEPDALAGWVLDEMHNKLEKGKLKALREALVKDKPHELYEAAAEIRNRHHHHHPHEHNHEHKEGHGHGQGQEQGQRQRQGAGPELSAHKGGDARGGGSGAAETASKTKAKTKKKKKKKGGSASLKEEL